MALFLNIPYYQSDENYLNENYIDLLIENNNLIQEISEFNMYVISNTNKLNEGMLGDIGKAIKEKVIKIYNFIKKLIVNIINKIKSFFGKTKAIDESKIKVKKSDYAIAEYLLSMIPDFNKAIDSKLKVDDLKTNLSNFRKIVDGKVEEFKKNYQDTIEVEKSKLNSLIEKIKAEAIKLEVTGTAIKNTSQTVANVNPDLVRTSSTDRLLAITYYLQLLYSVDLSPVQNNTTSNNSKENVDLNDTKFYPYNLIVYIKASRLFPHIKEKKSISNDDLETIISDSMKILTFKDDNKCKEFLKSVNLNNSKINYESNSNVLMHIKVSAMNKISNSNKSNMNEAIHSSSKSNIVVMRNLT
jgi:hypothetical protein